jgi:hypothetical protein
LTVEEQKYVARFCRCGRSVWSTEWEKRPFSLKLDPSVPFLGQSTLTIYDVGLPENCALPVTDIGFGKVSKHWRCLDTFSIHPCAVVTFLEPVPRMIERLGKLVHQPLYGS